MKVRNGFVSNSSSSSFVVISKEPLSVIKPADKKTPGYGYIRVNTTGASYTRGDIALCRTLADKLRHFTVLYAKYYESDKNYFLKMDEFQNKVVSLGEKYNYIINLSCPPLSGFVLPSGQDGEETEVVLYVDIDNECEYLDEVVEIIENEDTTELESYLFNPHSFCVLGGDEYFKTTRLAHKMRKFVDKEGYEYRKFGDIMEDIEIGEPCPWNEGETYTYSYHWGDCSFKDYIRNWHSQLSWWWWKIKHNKHITKLLRRFNIY